MAAAGIPAARPLPIAKAPCVIKADGLAPGKGVFVCHTQGEVDAGVIAAAALGQKIVIEELLEGPEVSLFALCDGTRAFPLGAAQDYKRAEDGDAGPNTGGMGAYSPVAGVDVAELVERVHQPVVDELARRGTPFVGCLFAGLMLTERGPRVLEFNARFGDPETQVLIPRIEGDLLQALAASAAGERSRDGRSRPRMPPSPSSSPGPTTRSEATTPARRSRASPRPRRSVRMSSTAGPRCTARRS